MSRPANHQAFLIVTHEISNHVLKLYNGLKKATSGLGDVFILYHVKNESAPIPVEGISIETFTDDILHELGYKPIGEKLLPGSNHFPLLQFSLRHPQYAYFWCIEDDVVFTGNWQHFFSKISQHMQYDFISSHLRRYADVPTWYWWKSLTTDGKEIEQKDMVNSFNPIYRLSKSAVEYVDKCLKEHYAGHHEALIATVLNHQGFSLADFSSRENHFTPSLSFCTLRTMRWKPVFITAGFKKNMLYHPVKAKTSIGQLYEYFKRTLQNRKEYFT